MARTFLGVVACLLGAWTPLVGFVAAKAQRRVLGVPPRPGRLLVATFLLTAVSWWLAFSAIVGAAAFPFADGAAGAALGVVVGLLLVPDLRFAGATAMLERPSLGLPGSLARSSGLLAALRAAAWPVVGAVASSAWLAFVEGPWRFFGLFVGFGVAPLAAESWAAELVPAPTARVTLEARDAGRYVIVGVAAFVVASALASPAAMGPGRLPDGHAAVTLPRSLAGTSVVIERDEHGLRVVARDGGGAGPVRAPSGRPIERARIARTPAGGFDLEAIDTAGEAFRLSLTADGVRLDDTPRDRLLRAFSARGLVALAALGAFLIFLAFARRDDQASGLRSRR